jgi:hypothetical protein
MKMVFYFFKNSIVVKRRGVFCLTFVSGVPSNTITRHVIQYGDADIGGQDISFVTVCQAVQGVKSHGEVRE